MNVVKNETKDGFIEFLNYISISLVRVEPDGGTVDQMWEKISQIEPLFGMSRDEVFITFQNLQLAANLPSLRSP